MHSLTQFYEIEDTDNIMKIAMNILYYTFTAHKIDRLWDHKKHIKFRKIIEMHLYELRSESYFLSFFISIEIYENKYSMKISFPYKNFLFDFLPLINLYYIHLKINIRTEKHPHASTPNIRARLYNKNEGFLL